MATPNEQKDIEENKTVAALGYVWILFLVPLLLKRKSKFAQFHAKQAMVLFIGEVIAVFVGWFPLIGWAYWVFILWLVILGFFKALGGQQYRLPIAADLADKLNI
jgi:uncharacterized membrane protein